MVHAQRVTYACLAVVCRINVLNVVDDCIQQVGLANRATWYLSCHIGDVNVKVVFDYKRKVVSDLIKGRLPTEFVR